MCYFKEQCMLYHIICTQLSCLLLLLKLIPHHWLCPHLSLTSHPATEHTLWQFASYLEKQNLKHETTKCYLSGIRFYHIWQASNDIFLSEMHKLKYILCGIKIEEAKKGPSLTKRLPVTPSLLTQIYGILSRNPTDA